jgi:hypothetical protein
MEDEKKVIHFDFGDDEDESKLKKWLPVAGGGAIVMLLSGGVFALINLMSGTTPPSQPLIQQISIVQPPPPPPPPPKIEEPPEPEMKEVDIEEPELEPVAEQDQLDESLDDALGLDAEGAAGADAFGLLAKKGGRGLVGSDPNAWYAGVLQRDIQAALSGEDDVRKGNYSVVVRIWLDDEGFIEDSELLGSTDNAALDNALKRVLSSRLRISRAPPEDLPQPIRLRISSRS